MNQPEAEPHIAVGAEDEALLSKLGELARQADPVPDLVYELGHAAFALRRLDAELAELVADTALDPLAGVRSSDVATRLLTFEAGELVVEVEVSGAGADRVVLGQVVPAPPGRGTVRLEHRDGSSAGASLDGLGGFRFDAVPAGLVRLHVEAHGVAPVTTSWVRL